MSNLQRSRLTVSIEEVNTMSLTQIAAIGNPHTQEAILKRLMPSRKAELIKECEAVIFQAQEKINQVGYEAASPRSFQGAQFVDPYTILKKYSYIYTTLSGWMTEEDLSVREKGVVQALFDDRFKKGGNK